MATGREAHWNTVYATKGDTTVSWFQETPSPSLELIALADAGPESAILDVGGGASRLVDALLQAGHGDVTVLDLSEEALRVSRARLGPAGDRVTWIVADAATWDPPRAYDIWHDRAAFHFLTGIDQQRAYVARVQRGLRVGGHLIIGTFAQDGPEKCSGLPVARHDAASLAAVLGEGYQLVERRRHGHTTPWGSTQNFQFSVFQRAA